MNLSEYIQNLNRHFKSGISSEHTYRSDLQILIQSLAPNVLVTNEPRRIACGAPDYIISRKGIPIGYIEAKDIGADLKDKTYTEQFERYKASLGNLIFTDYIDFHFYRNGQFLNSVKVGKISGDKIISLTENFQLFTDHISEFTRYSGITITSSKKLAEMMAGKARLLSAVIEKSVSGDDANSEDTSLKDQMSGFKKILIHDIEPKAFADVYAQTIAYGMFAARFNDPTLDSFSRQEAAELIPKSNPFLRKLFSYIAGPDIDDRIKWIVDDLAEIFRSTDIAAILKNFGSSTQTTDPVIHFYETFLSEYDPKLRKARGVWYTPEPVVNFIVRAVDDILKTEFNLPMGLADTSKIKIRSDVQGKKEEREVHKVQILDPAAGTGSFLAEVIKQIYAKMKANQGIWSSYVENHLIPRLNGFELLMASYAMAHLKLDILLRETGYNPVKTSPGPSEGGGTSILNTSPSPSGRVGVGSGQRYRVFLTNSLEEHHPDTGTLFASWLSDEANEANHIKRDTPVMCVIGNPPYSGESANKGGWIMSLMEDYKKEPGGKEKLNERNPKWINDDYVKFLRYGQYLIEKNGEGILAFINPHGYLDNPTFRGMRWNLLKTYDKIYTLDLHGNSKKKETAPDGSIDQNVFDIMQGVSINLFIKTGKKKANELGKVFHFDLYGKREYKYDFLIQNSVSTVAYKELPNKAPMYFMVKKEFDIEEEYNAGIKLTDLFPLNNVGIVTARDSFTIHDTKEDVKNTIEEFLNLDDETARNRFSLGKDVRDWQVNFARKDLQKHYPNIGKFVKINYRPFDVKWTYYTGKSKGFHCYPRTELMQHFLKGENIGIDLCRQIISDSYSHIFVTNKIADDSFVSNKSRERGYVHPLYLYSDDGTVRKPNLNMEIVNKIAEGLGLKFVEEKDPTLTLPEGEGTGESPSFGGVGEVSLSDPMPVSESPSFGGVGEVSLNNVGEVKFGEVRESPRYVTANAETYKLIKEIRDDLMDNPTEAEKIIWEYLRNKKTGHKIRRQHIINNFITDFVCLRKKVVIEIDGKIHLKQKEYDELRTEELNQLGYDVIRFKNEEIYADPNLVANKIKEFLDKKDDPTLTLPEGEGTGESPSFGGVGEVSLNNVGEVFSPIDLLDYIYAVLHTPSYREKYKEFLKIDFPRVPYPADKDEFWRLVNIGSELRKFHLLEHPDINNFITEYPVSGDNIVRKVSYTEGKVYINDTQFFNKVPVEVWEFYIGGYQPAQKWLKDRKARELTFEDILHYQRIIVALNKTHKIMNEELS